MDQEKENRQQAERSRELAQRIMRELTPAGVQVLGGSGSLEKALEKIGARMTQQAEGGALLVAEQLGIAPADFLYLGDTKVDMTCACSAGMNPVGVLWGFRTAQELLDNGAKVLISHPMELLEKFNL
jgi:phosphoglycolate phosphatase-like HAD superfamily hydrolase